MLLSGANSEAASNKRPQDDAIEGDEAIKKARTTDEILPPDQAGRSVMSNTTCKTLHVRALPVDVTEQDVYALCHAFGRVVKVLLIRTKQQGFVEFENAQQANAMLLFYASTQATIRGKAVFFQFSNRDNIAAPKNDMETPNHILLVTIQNPLYPITIDVLNSVFAKYGEIARMITFVKNATHQALVEYKSTPQAQAARQALDGQNIYQGCCTLKIQFSQLEKLTVKFNNEKSRDFENPSLPYAPVLGAAGTPAPAGSPFGGAVAPYQPAAAAAYGQQAAAQYGQQAAAVAAASQYAQQAAAGAAGQYGQAAAQAGAQYGQQAAGGSSPPYGQQGGAAAAANPYGQQQQQQQQAAGAYGQQPQAAGAYGQQQQAAGAYGQQYPYGQYGQPGYDAYGQFRAGVPLVPGMPGNMVANAGSTVVIASQLNPKRVTCDALFTLFGVYGDVLRVKILYNKPDTALIQMATHEQAENAILYLNNAPLLGSNISTNLSKHTTIAMPRADQESVQLTKDYSGSPQHRFRGSGKHMAHLCPPTAVLHLAGLPAAGNIPDEEVKALFAPYGTVVGFKFFTKDRRMGLVQMGSVAEAIEALVHVHQHKFYDSHIRVSFSKSTLQGPI